MFTPNALAISSQLFATDFSGTALRDPRHSYAHSPFGCSPLYAPFKGEWPERNVQLFLLGQGYRAYVPALMRFAKADDDSPFGRGGYNAYAYVAADPVNFDDPDGHGVESILKIGTKTAGKAAKRVAFKPSNEARLFRTTDIAFNVRSTSTKTITEPLIYDKWLYSYKPAPISNTRITLPPTKQKLLKIGSPSYPKAYRARTALHYTPIEGPLPRFRSNPLPEPLPMIPE
ncbi:RHS repeat-associated core domain-containing protein [Pseudomonas sp. NPDC007930]|uniref:RHS repeat-associated core domain-containing protein n=1 Tax=Pseudomonas sp. NPDC007930 TaxID=3364417 RepID=UPI0036E45C2B